jgi:hypothetical protein
MSVGVRLNNVLRNVVALSSQRPTESRARQTRRLVDGFSASFGGNHAVRSDLLNGGGENTPVVLRHGGLESTETASPGLRFVAFVFDSVGEAHGISSVAHSTTVRSADRSALRITVGAMNTCFSAVSALIFVTEPTRKEESCMTLYPTIDALGVVTLVA